MQDFPLRQEDKALDDLASEARIRSQQDAATYVLAAARRFGLDEERSASLRDVLDRLAMAEYAAVNEPSHRVPEWRIVTVFNELMAEIGAPAWAHTTAVEVHSARVVLAKVLLPHGVSRSRDGGLLDTARPVEAIYVLRLLEFQRRTAKEDMQQVPSDALTEERGAAHFQAFKPNPEALRRQNEYQRARDEYLAQHSDQELVSKVGQLLTHLGLT